MANDRLVSREAHTGAELLELVVLEGAARRAFDAACEETAQHKADASALSDRKLAAAPALVQAWPRSDSALQAKEWTATTVWLTEGLLHCNNNSYSLTDLTKLVCHPAVAPEPSRCGAFGCGGGILGGSSANSSHSSSGSSSTKGSCFGREVLVFEFNQDRTLEVAWAPEPVQNDNDDDAAGAVGSTSAGGSESDSFENGNEHPLVGGAWEAAWAGAWESGATGGGWINTSPQKQALHTEATPDASVSEALVWPPTTSTTPVSQSIYTPPPPPPLGASSQRGQAWDSWIVALDVVLLARFELTSVPLGLLGLRPGRDYTYTRDEAENETEPPGTTPFSLLGARDIARQTELPTLANLAASSSSSSPRTSSEASSAISGRLSGKLSSPLTPSGHSTGSGTAPAVAEPSSGGAVAAVAVSPTAEAILGAFPPHLRACAAGAWRTMSALEACHQRLVAARAQRVRATEELEQAVLRREQCMAVLSHLKRLQEVCRAPLDHFYHQSAPASTFVVALSTIGRKLSQSLIEVADLPRLKHELDFGAGTSLDARGRHSSFSSKSLSFSSLSSSWGPSGTARARSPHNDGAPVAATSSATPVDTASTNRSATATSGASVRGPTTPVKSRARSPQPKSSSAHHPHHRAVASPVDAVLQASRAKAAKRRQQVAKAVRLGVDADATSSLEKLYMCRLLYDWQEVPDRGSRASTSSSSPAREVAPGKLPEDLSAELPEEVRRDADQVSKLVATLAAKQEHALPALHILARQKALRRTYEVLVKHPAGSSNGLNGGVHRPTIRWIYGEEAAANAAANRSEAEPAPYVFVQNQ